MSGDSPSLGRLDKLLDPDATAVWVPGAVFALALLGALRQWRHYLIVPGMLFAAIALFHAALAATGISVSEAGERGWLLGPFPGGAAWQAPALASAGAIEWEVLAAQLPKMLAIAGVSLVGLMLNASGLELATKHDMDIDRELRAAGAANLGCGLLGGLAGYHALSVSLLGQRMGANSRLIGVVASLVCLAALACGPGILAYVPKAMLGGLLLFMGLGFLMEWLYDARHHLPPADYAIVLLIVVVIGVAGYMEGVAFGILLASLLFIFRFSKIDVIGSSFRLNELSSSVERTADERRTLRATGKRSRIFNLRGYLFFGSANTFLESVRQACAHEPRRAYFVFNLRRVLGVDITAAQVFIKLGDFLDSKGIEPVYCGMSEAVAQTFAVAEVFRDRERLVLGNLDLALRYVEDRLLAGQGETSGGLAIGDKLQSIVGDRDKAQRLLSIMQRLALEPGAYLFRQGDVGAEIFVIESGAIEIRLEATEGKTTRLREFREGSMVGEMAVYTSAKRRTASAVAIEPSILYRLDPEDLKRLGERAVEYEGVVHELIARRLASRLSFMNQRTEADL